MLETEEDLRELAALLERSIATAGRFLRETYQMPEHSLSPEQVVEHLQGVKVLALAHVTERGEPRVAPLNAVFVRGRFWVPTATYSARSRQLARRPAVSVTYWRPTLAMMVHGAATPCGPEHEMFSALNEIHRQDWFQSLCERGEGVYLRIDPGRMYTWIQHPEPR